MSMFLASLRRMLAFDNADIVLGEAAKGVIQSVYIPALKAEMGEGENRDLQAQIDEWERISSPSGSGAAKLNNIAAKAIRKVKGTYQFATDEDALDVASTITLKFFSNPKYMASLKNFDFRQGPGAFSKWWTGVMHRQAARVRGGSCVRR